MSCRAEVNQMLLEIPNIPQRINQFLNFFPMISYCLTLVKKYIFSFSFLQVDWIQMSLPTSNQKL